MSERAKNLMKKLATLCVYLMLMTSCIIYGGDPWYANRPDTDKRTYIQSITQKSIAMVKEKTEGNPMDGHRAFCGGVWITNRTFLTAMHCAQAGAESDLERMIRSITDVNPPESSYIGQEVLFTTHRINVRERESGHIGTLGVRTGKIIAGEYDSDLALIVADESILADPHGVAVIRPEISMTGDRMFIIGHPAGRLFSYSEVFVSGIRVNETVDGTNAVRLLEIKGPVWYGNSGGGSFDGYGQLTGICSFKIQGASDMSFFIHHSTINTFLGKHRLKIVD